MDRVKRFDHFYEQYRVEVSEADYVYQRAGLWLTANGLVGTALAALVTGAPGSRFSVDVTQPTSAVVSILTALALFMATAFMGFALFPRKYGRFSLPHEILAFRAAYRTDLERAGYPADHREAAESETMFEELSKVLAEKTKRNARINENRHRALGRSSVLTLVALGGIMILLAGAAVGAARARGVKPMPIDNTSASERPPSPPPSSPPESGTQTRGDPSPPQPPPPSSPPPSGSMTKGG